MGAFAYLELDGVPSDAPPRDGAWHRVHVDGKVGPSGAVDVALTAGAHSDVFFDDVTLFAVDD
jgi:hypothetical protein